MSYSLEAKIEGRDLVIKLIEDDGEGGGWVASEQRISCSSIAVAAGVMVDRTNE